MFFSRRMFIAAMAGTLGSLAVESDALGKGRKPKDGKYEVEFRGYLRGKGTATVSGGTVVNITGEVVDEDDKKGNFNVGGLRLVNDRFKGNNTGEAMGLGISIITGRVDAPTPTVRVGRLTATFGLQNGRYGRLVGELKD